MFRQVFSAAIGVVVATTVIAGSPTAQAQSSVDLDQFLQDMKEKSESLVSLSLRGSRSIEAQHAGRPIAPREDTELEIAFAEPGQLRMAVESPRSGSTLVVSDGVQVWTYSAQSNAFTVQSVGSDAATETGGDTGNSVAGDARASVLSQIMPWQLPEPTLLRDESIDVAGKSVPCVVIHSLAPTGEQMTLWVDRANHVVLREERRGAKSVNGPNGPMTIDVVATATYREVKVDQDIPKSKFVFTPPDGAGQVDSFNMAQGIENNSPLVGKPAPDFELTDLDGNSVRLSDLRGKPVLLDFWATWCGPCKIELPHIQKLHEEFGVDDITVLAISSEQPALVRRYLERAQYTFPSLIDGKREVTGKYGVTSIPVVLVIDSQGVVRKHFIGAQPERVLRKALAAVGVTSDAAGK